MSITVYSCSNCHKSISKSTRVCPHCHVSLAGIRCQSCYFTGGEKDFANDLCPKCGVRVVLPKQAANASEDDFSLGGCLFTLIIIGVIISQLF